MGTCQCSSISRISAPPRRDLKGERQVWAPDFKETSVLSCREELVTWGWSGGAQSLVLGASRRGSSHGGRSGSREKETVRRIGAKLQASKVLPQ